MTPASEPATPSSQPTPAPAPEPGWVRALDAVAAPYFAFCKRAARALNRKRR